MNKPVKNKNQILKMILNNQNNIRDFGVSKIGL